MHSGAIDKKKNTSFLQPAEKKKSESESSIYFSTDHSIYSSSSSKRSLYPPESWPTSADLARDSDVYPLDKSSYAALRRPHGDSLDSLIGSFADVKVMPIIPVPSSPVDVDDICPVHSLTASFSDDTERETCRDVCGSVCSCHGSSSTSEDITGTCVSTETSPTISAPEFDLAPIRTFIDLPIGTKATNKLCFGETLIISREVDVTLEKEGRVAGSVFSQIVDPYRTVEIGGMCINIQKAAQNLVVFCTSQFSYENSGATSSILSVVDRNFNLIEEKRTEALHRNDWKEEKSLHVFREGKKLTAFRTSIRLEGTKQHRGSLDMKVEGDVVLDGGGFVLMRYLILKKFKGDLEVWSMHISGELCRAAYNVGKPKMFIINNRPVETIRVTKMLMRNNRKTDISKTYFLPSGHLVRHRWMDCPYFLHLNPVARIPPCNYSLCLEKTWEEDIQLFSRYLDLKQEKKSHIESFLEDNGEMKCMIKDYLLCLLQNKPKHVLDFTIEYFQKLLNEE